MTCCIGEFCRNRTKQKNKLCTQCKERIRNGEPVKIYKTRKAEFYDNTLPGLEGMPEEKK